MRVTQGMLTQQLLYNMSNVNQRIQLDQEELSTGKTLNRASDSPLNVSQDMSISTSLSQMQAYQSSISSGQSWVQNTVSATQSMISNLQTTQTNVLQALNTPNANPSALEALAETVQQTVSQIYSTLDTKQGNDYIFGGAITDQPPSTFAQSAFGSLSYGSATIHESVDSVTATNGIAQSQPPSTMVSQITGTGLAAGTYQLEFDSGSITPASGTSPTSFSGLVTLVSVTPTGTSVVATGTASQFGAGVTLTGGGVTLSVTLGSLFTAASGATGTYDQTDTLVVLPSASNTDPRFSSVMFPVSDGINIAANLTAADLFHTVPQGATADLQTTLSSIVTDLYSASSALQQAQSAGTGASGTAGYQQAMTNLKNDLSNLQANTAHVVNQNAAVGTQLQRMNAMQNQVGQYVQTLSDQKSQLEDANMAQVITQFSTDQTVYQAALQMGAKIILPTLISYLP